MTDTNEKNADVMEPHTVPSPFARHMDIEILERSRGFCRLGYTVRDHHRNRTGVLHGGVLLALIDHGGGLADSWAEEGEAPRLSITIDLNSHFTGAVRSGRIVVTTRVISEGRSLYFASTEIHDEAGRLVAYGSSTHKRVRGREDDAG